VNAGFFELFLPVRQVLRRLIEFNLGTSACYPSYQVERVELSRRMTQQMSYIGKSLDVF
jgi:hypothetical protein